MIHYKPDELFALWEELKGKDKSRVIAYNDEMIIQMYDDGTGVAMFLVSYMDEPVDEVSVDNPAELAENAKALYEIYIGEDSGWKSAADSSDEDPEDGDDAVLSELELQHEDEINQNEIGLFDAAANFIHEVTGEDKLVIMEKHEDVVEDFLEHSLKYLFLKHKQQIYRPMVMVMGDGTEQFKDFPYPFLDLSDEESNPLFMP